MRPSASNGTRGNKRQDRSSEAGSASPWLAFLKTSDEPTVDNATLTCRPEGIAAEGKPGGPRLACPITPVKRFIAPGRAPTHRRTAPLHKGPLRAGGCLGVAAERGAEVSAARWETSAASPNP